MISWQLVWLPLNYYRLCTNSYPSPAERPQRLPQETTKRAQTPQLDTKGEVSERPILPTRGNLIWTDRWSGWFGCWKLSINNQSEPQNNEKRSTNDLKRVSEKKRNFVPILYFCDEVISRFSLFSGESHDQSLPAVTDRNIYKRFPYFQIASFWCLLIHLQHKRNYLQTHFLQDESNYSSRHTGSDGPQTVSHRTGWSLYLIYTRSCVELQRNRSGPLWCRTESTWSFQKKLKVQIKRETVKREENKRKETTKDWQKIFWPHQSDQKEGRGATKGPQQPIKNHQLSPATAAPSGGGRDV